MTGPWLPMLFALAGLALTAWSGALALCAFCPGMRKQSVWLRGALGFGAGVGLISLLMFWAGWASLGFSAWLLILGQCAVGLASVGHSLFWERKSALSMAEAIWPFRPCKSRAPHDAPIQDSPRTLRLLMLAALLVVMTFTAWLSVKEQASFPDARTVWMLKARVFYLDGGFDGIYFTEWLGLANRLTYPILVPLYGAYMHFITGGVNDWAVKLGHVAFYAALLILLYRMLAPRMGRYYTVLAVLLFALCGQTFTMALWGTADLQFAFYILAALWAFMFMEREGPSLPMACIAGLFLACLAFTKEEGTATVCLLILTFLVVVRPWKVRSQDKKFPGAIMHAACLTALPLLVVFTWNLFCRSRSMEPFLLQTAPLDKLMESPGLIWDRTLFVMKSYWTEFFHPRWLFAWPLFFLALLLSLATGKSAAMKTAFWFIPLQLLLYAGVYVFLAQKVEWHVQTSIGRIFFHSFPALYVVTLVRFLGGREPC